jgi:hypothetical protein
MDIRKFSSTGRPLDFNYRTNRIIAVITLIVLIGGFIYQLIIGNQWISALGWGFGVSISVFLSWAISREIDPDHDYSAFVGTGLTLIGSIIWYPPSFFLLFWALLASRIINHSTGFSANIADSVILTILTAILVIVFKDWITGIASGIIFLFDGILRRGKKRQYIFAFIQFILVGTSFLFIDYTGFVGMLSGIFVVGIVVIAAASVPFIILYKNVRSVGDDTGETLLPVRIQILYSIIFIWLVLLTFKGGMPGFKSLFPIWSSLAGTVIYTLVIKIR